MLNDPQQPGLTWIKTALRRFGRAGPSWGWTECRAICMPSAEAAIVSRAQTAYEVRLGVTAPFAMFSEPSVAGRLRPPKRQRLKTAPARGTRLALTSRTGRPGPMATGFRKCRRRGALVLVGPERQDSSSDKDSSRRCGEGLGRAARQACRSGGYGGSLPFPSRRRRCSRVYSSSSDTPNSSSITPHTTSVEARTRARLLAGTISP